MRAAVIGLGHIAKQHLGALATCAGVEVVGVCDISPAAAESTAERFGLKRWFHDYDRMLEEQRPDVVHVLTPPATHHEICHDCLQFGAHVLVEKPVTQQLSQLEELVALAATQKRRLVEDHNYLFNRAIQQMIARVHSGKFGQVRHVDIEVCLANPHPRARKEGANGQVSNRQTAFGPVVEFLTHLSYLAYAFIGEHRKVYSSWNIAAADGLMDSDNMQALVEGKHGTARLGFSSDIQPDCFLVRVYGTRMQMETNLFEVGLVRTAMMGGPKPLVPIRNMMRRGGSEMLNAARSLRRKLSGGAGPYEGLWELVRRNYESLHSGLEPPVSTEQIVAVNRLFHAIVDEAPVSCAC